MIKTKKYNFGNLLFCNEFTYYKIVNNALDIALLRLHYDLKTLKDFKIVVREELGDNKVYFYVERWNSGFIKEYNFNDLLK
jgi:hypothetical protein